jgi:hypothetical protein
VTSFPNYSSWFVVIFLAVPNTEVVIVLFVVFS